MQSGIGSCGNLLVWTSGSAYAWNQTTSTWASQGLGGTGYTQATGSGGNLVIWTGMTSTSFSLFDHRTSAWTSQDMGDTLRWVIPDSSDNGNFMAASRIHACAFNGTTSTWSWQALAGTPADRKGSGGNFVVCTPTAAYAWNHATSSWTTQTLTETVRWAVGSNGNFAIRTNGFAYAWSQDTSNWTEQTLSGAGVGQAIGSGGNFLVRTATTVYAWNQATSNWTAQTLTGSTTGNPAGSGGNFVIGTNLSPYTYLWNGDTSAWTTHDTGETAWGVVGSEGNLAIRTSSTIDIWNHATPGWSSHGSDGTSGVAASGGNFVVYSSGSADAWNQTTSGWSSQGSSSIVYGSDGNFVARMNNSAHAWNRATSIWTTQELSGSAQGATGDGGDFVVWTSGSAYAWNHVTSTWTPQALSGTVQWGVGSGGNCAIWSSSNAYAWSQATSTWTAQTLSGTSSSTSGSGGNFVVRTNSSPYVHVWNQATSAWTTQDLGGSAQYGFGSGGNFVVWTTSTAWAWNHTIYPILQVSPTSLAFAAVQSGPAPAAADFSVENAGAPTLDYQVQESCPWLSVSPAGGGSAPPTGAVTVSVESAGLCTGVYHADITVTAAGAANSPRLVAVTLTVMPPPASALLHPPDASEGEPLTGLLDWSDAPGANTYVAQLGTMCGEGSETEITSSETPYGELQPLTTYFWRVKSKDACEHWSDYGSCSSFTTTGTTGANAVPIPRESGIASIAPNPSPGWVDIHYALASGGEARLRIYDASGRAVRSMDLARTSAGYFTSHWDGLDDLAVKAPTGVYFVQLAAGGRRVERRVLIIR